MDEIKQNQPIDCLSDEVPLLDSADAISRAHLMSRLHERVLDAQSQGVVIFHRDDDLTIVYANPAFLQLFSLTELEIHHQSLYQFYPNDLQNHKAQLTMALMNEQSITLELKRMTSSEIICWHEWIINPLNTDESSVPYFVATVKDITEKKCHDDQLTHDAFHDPLTDLPNRKLFELEFQRILDKALSEKKLGALIFMDLNRFKQVNDQYGHDVGDELLKAVAQRLRNHVRHTDLVARMGGDEFVIVLSKVDRIEDASNVVDKLLASLNKPYQIKGHHLEVTASMGLCVFPEQGDSVERLLREADQAMYREKQKA